MESLIESVESAIDSNRCATTGRQLRSGRRSGHPEHTSVGCPGAVESTLPIIGKR